MRLGIVGGGTVGGATARAFTGHVEEVRVHDRLPERSTHTRREALECDLVLVCLPTPQASGSLECYTGHVETFFATVMGSQTNFVLKSTVPIGFTRQMRERFSLPNLVHSPEFLTARTADHDAANPVRNVIGFDEAFEDSNDCAERLESLYQSRFPGVPIYLMHSDESEAVKLFQNAFSAVKVACFNELRSLADKLGLDWDRVREALLAGGWINPMHTQVPGRDGWGFSGTCLPKDLASLVHQLQQNGLIASVCVGAHNRNLHDRERT